MRPSSHTGVLSTFYAEQVLLPETGHGIVLLANQYRAFTDLRRHPQWPCRAGHRRGAGSWSGFAVPPLRLLLMPRLVAAGSGRVAMPG
ncbi:MAG: hypothetical protein ACRDZO_26035 [Egibacteraceae bacterium]